MPSAKGLLSRLAYGRLKQNDIDPVPLLKKARLTAPQIDDRTVRLSVQSQIRFLDLAADALRDPQLGSHLAQAFDLREIGLLYYIAASSETIGDALPRMVRYSRSVNEGVSLGCAEEGGSVVVSFGYVGVSRHSDRQQIEFWVTAVVRACRQLTGRRVVPSGVKLAHRRRDGSFELDEFMGTAVQFDSGMDAVVLPGSLKAMPVISADPYLNELLVAHCEEALARRPGGFRSVPSDVENAIASLLPHGKARLDEVARRLGMSPRTLARRLAAEGVTFAGLLNRLRVDLARRHLGDPELSISQIAWLLGYRETSAFTHAFKRWIGKTPREARARAGSAQE